MTTRRGHSARPAAHIEDVPSHRERTFPTHDDSQTPVICEKTQSSRDTYVLDPEQHPQPLTKTYKHFCFISLFNIRELSRSPVIHLGLARDS